VSPTTALEKFKISRRIKIKGTQQPKITLDTQALPLFKDNLGEIFKLHHLTFCYRQFKFCRL
jgi:hypothetical protein